MIKPLHDNVLLKKQVVENKTASGIILTNSTKQADNIGVVVAVGEGKLVDGKLVELTVKPNDKVIYDKYSVTEVEYESEKYLLLPESKILAIID